MSGRGSYTQTPSTGSPHGYGGLPTYSFPASSQGAAATPFAPTAGNGALAKTQPLHAARARMCRRAYLQTLRAHTCCKHKHTHTRNTHTHTHTTAQRPRGGGVAGAPVDPEFEAALRLLRAEVAALKDDSWQFEAPRHQAS